MRLFYSYQNFQENISFYHNKTFMISIYLIYTNFYLKLLADDIYSNHEKVDLIIIITLCISNSCFKDKLSTELNLIFFNTTFVLAITPYFNKILNFIICSCVIFNITYVFINSN